MIVTTDIAEGQQSRDTAEVHPPKVAFCGNIGNTHFQIVQSLRSAGWDAHLFVGNDSALEHRPESDDPDLAGNYPPWIHEGPWMQARHVAVPWTSPLVKELREYDLVVASGSLPVVVQFANRPWILLTTGADVTKTPFPYAFRKQRNSRWAQLGFFVVAFWQRRAIRNATQIWTQPFTPFLSALDRLGVDQDQLGQAWLSLAVDTQMFAPRNPTETPTTLQQRISDAGDFVVFHPSRLVFDDSPEMKSAGQWKGSQTVLEGFAEFVAAVPASRPVLVLPLRDHAAAMKDARNRIEDLGIADRVFWAQAPRSTGFTRTEIVSLYQCADAVVDQFSAGWFGNVSVEAQSCGVPVVSLIDQEAITKMYGRDWHWLHANSPSTMAQQLLRLAQNPADARQIGEAARSWAQRHHGLKAMSEYYTNAILEAAPR